MPIAITQTSWTGLVTGCDVPACVDHRSGVADPMAVVPLARSKGVEIAATYECGHTERHVYSFVAPSTGTTTIRQWLYGGQCGRPVVKLCGLCRGAQLVIRPIYKGKAR